MKDKNAKKTFLIIAPHPDDAELGMGGTVIKLRQKGHRVYIIDLTTGEPTPYGSNEKRRKEALNSTRILRVNLRINLGFENRFLFDTKNARLVLAERIRELRPDVIFCPYHEDAHPDHTACTKIAEAARFYAKLTKIRLKGKPYYPPRLFYFFCTHLRIIPKISFCVDISRQMNAKFRAVGCYPSQFVANPKGKLLLAYVKAHNSFLGKLSGCEYAEAFYSREIIRADDLYSL